MCIVLWGGIFNKCQVGHFNESIVQILYVFTNFHSSINKERGVLKLPTITVDLSFFSLSSTSFIYFDTVIKWIRIWDVCILPTNWMLIYCKFFLFFIDNIPCLEIYFDAYTVISVFLSLRFIWYIFPSPLLLIYYFSIQFLENSHNWVISTQQMFVHLLCRRYCVHDCLASIVINKYRMRMYLYLLYRAKMYLGLLWSVYDKVFTSCYNTNLTSSAL